MAYQERVRIYACVMFPRLMGSLIFLLLLLQAILESMLKYANFVMIDSVILFKEVPQNLSIIKLTGNQTLPKLKFK